MSTASSSLKFHCPHPGSLLPFDPKNRIATSDGLTNDDDDDDDGDDDGDDDDDDENKQNPVKVFRCFSTN